MRVNNWFVDEQRRYQEWARSFCTDEELRTHTYDEAGYPDWSEVEARFKSCIAAGALTTLTEAEVGAALFLIARSWDVGRIVPWLSGKRTLGMFAEDDILFLARASLAHPDSALDDARYQLAEVLPRIKRAEVPDLLRKLFEFPHEYTRRLALYGLAEVGYPAIRELVARAWLSDDEHAKLGCLHVLATWVDDPALLQDYLARAAAFPGEHLAIWRAKLLLELGD